MTHETEIAINHQINAILDMHELSTEDLTTVLTGLIARRCFLAAQGAADERDAIATEKRYANTMLKDIKGKLKTNHLIEVK